MQFPTVLARIISVFLAVITPLLSSVFGMLGKFTEIPGEAVAAMEKAGGFMAGICHPEPEYQQIKDANIGWIREDIPFPFDENGQLTQSYIYMKNTLKEYADNGIKVMAITPNPRSYLEHGLDIRDPDDIDEIREIARFYIRDYQGIAGAFQIANEMGVDRFTKPFKLTEAAKFIGVQLKAMYPLRGDILIGYNLGGLGIAVMPFLMMPYSRYTDYVGADLYFGSFENVIKSMETFPALIKMIHTVTRKPIIISEFGYIGYGEPKTEEEKTAILEKYGVHSEEEARQNIDAFIDALPERIRDEFHTYYKDLSDDEKWALLFEGEYANHIYCELPEDFILTGYPHSPEGQAKFYADVIPIFKSLDYCIGAFIYMWNDSEACYVCGQSDCPVETGWGIVDGKGNEKPAYYTVRDAFAN